MRFCFCVLGWHFAGDFYQQLYQLEQDKYIVSHRPQTYLQDRGLYEKIRDDVRFMPNTGLDWGGYHQFNETVDLRSYDAVIYCHDDVMIKDPSVTGAIEQMFRDPGVKVVGNGNNGADTEFRFGKHRRHMFWPDDDDFIVRTVRGSFFAARVEVFDHIGNFPVYWDASERNLKKGNISLRNFGYIVTKTFGLDAIAYLEPESWLETRYLVELRRGAPVVSPRP